MQLGEENAKSKDSIGGGNDRCCECGSVGMLECGNV